MNTLIKFLSGLLLKLTLALKEVYPNTKPGSPERQNTVRAWENQVKAVIARYMQTAYFLGYGPDLPEPQEVADTLAPMVQTQFDFLEGFATEIEENEEEWQKGWEARAESYSGSVTQPYWQGKVRMLPIPAIPGDHTTQCFHCQCKLDIKRLDGDGNFNVFWKMKDGAEHCQTCRQRAMEWNPLKIRDNRLVIE